MQSPFHSPMFNLFAQDNGTIAAPLADGLRRRPRASGQRFMPPFGMPQMGAYDSSGINPHGMYNGTFGQMQPQGLPGMFPGNPGGFHAMGGLPGFFQRYA